MVRAPQRAVSDAYAQLLARLYSTRRLGVKLELGRVRAVLERMGQPQRAVSAIVQVAGTNGKGSTVAFVDAALRAAGVRTATFTSPHLSRFVERFGIGGVPVDEAEVVAAGAEVFAAAADVPLTFFELATLMALGLFRRAGVEAAVLEVGMGGRLDATNAVDADVAAVTGVALDHQAFLGSTLSEIAGEKAGIFKPGRAAVIGQCGEPEAIDWLVRAAKRVGAQPVEVAAAQVPGDWAVGLLGAHQRANAACAAAILDVLRRSGRLDARWGEPELRAAFAAARCPGRFEKLASDPDTFVDAAHNPHGARALAGLIGRATLVLAVSRDKDASALVDALAPVACRFFITETRSDRAQSAQTLAALVRQRHPEIQVETAATAAEAIERARACGDGPVVIAGSLFLVGEARQHLLGEPADPLLLTDPLP
jgi:dihydrofolate synthase / folylpolyglutamate synthase